MAPRTGTRRGSAGGGGDGRGIEPGDNAKAVAEAEQVQFISFGSKLQGYDSQIAELQLKMDGLRTERKAVTALANAAGFPAWLFKDVLGDLKKPRTDLAKREALRAKVREYYSLPTGKPERQDMLPETTRDAAFWSGDGYTSALRGDPCEPPSGCGVHGQSWMSGWHDGQAVLAKALAPKEPGLNRPAGEVDPFEASPAELESQITRQTVQAAREGLDRIGQGAAPEAAAEPAEEAVG